MWDYRVIKKEILGEDSFTIHEVYYDLDGKPYLVTENACYPAGETIEELKEDFEHYKSALDKPVLNYSDFEQLEQE
jgi:hypothetical protein